MTSDGKGYPIPDPVDPAALRCIKVYVPSDPLYIGAFFHSLSYFSNWYAFERDDLHRGKDAAAVWQAALDLTRAAFEAGEGCESDMTFDMRVKAGFPHITQASTDGGLTWHDAIIQPSWSSQTVFPPFASDTLAKQAAGGMIKKFWQGVPQQIETMLADGDTFSRDQIANDIYAEMARYNPLPSVRTAVRGLVDAIADAGSTDGLFNDCKYNDFWNELWDTVLNNPDTWPLLLPDLFGGFGVTGNDAIDLALGGALGALGGGALWQYTVGGGLPYFDGFDEPCIEGFSCDFTIEECGWYPDGGATVWTEGEGFEQGSYNTPTVITKLLDPAVTLHRFSITMEYDYTYSSTYLIGRSLNALVDGVWQELMADVGFVDPHTEPNPMVWEGSIAGVGALRFYVSHNSGDHRLYDVVAAEWSIN